MKTYISTILLLLFGISGIAQEKKVLLLDKDTGLPIDVVNVYYPALNTGSVSNADGIVKVNIQPRDTLYFSNISYEIVKLSEEELISTDTVFMQPKTYLLEEFVVYNYDLEKKIKEILQNYGNIYQISSTLYECTYKESAKIDGKFSRLNQVQLNWWSKYGYLKGNNSFDKDNQLSVTRIDYSKNEKGFFDGGFLDNIFVISGLYPNWYFIMLLRNTDNIQINKIEKEERHTKITFSASIIENNKLTQNLENSFLIIDHKTGAITDFYWNAIYNNQIKNDTNRETGKPFTSEVKNHSFRLSMKQLSNGKWTIGNLASKVNVEIVYQNSHSNLALDQNFFITREQKGKKVRKADRININQAFYKSFPTKEKTNNTMLLTKEELEFINQK